VKIRFSYAPKWDYWFDNDGGGVGIKLLRGENVASVGLTDGSELSLEVGPRNELVLSFQESLDVVLFDQKDINVGDDPVVEQLRSYGFVQCKVEEQIKGYSPVDASTCLLKPALKCIAVLAHNPDIFTHFADLSFASMPEELSLEVNGRPVRPKSRATDLGHRQLSGPLTRPPRPLPTADEFKWALSQYGADWVSLVLRGDYAAFQREAPITVVLWAAAIEQASYAARKKISGGDSENFSPHLYLKRNGLLNLTLTDDDFIACCELWGCRHEMVHNGRALIRTATGDGRTSKDSKTRPFDWEEEARRFREALLRVIRAIQDSPTQREFTVS
jgi:hypothetical protein